MSWQHEPSSAIVVEAAEKSQAKFSRSTQAHLVVAKKQLIATRKSMLHDMSVGQFSTPQEALVAIMELQKIQQSLAELDEKVATEAAPGFSSYDVETMRTMKRDGATENMIAHRFKTNQTKVNRLLNGVSSPEDNN